MEWHGEFWACSIHGINLAESSPLGSLHRKCTKIFCWPSSPARLFVSYSQMSDLWLVTADPHFGPRSPTVSFRKMKYQNTCQVLLWQSLSAGRAERWGTLMFKSGQRWLQWQCDRGNLAGQWGNQQLCKTRVIGCGHPGLCTTCTGGDGTVYIWMHFEQAILIMQQMACTLMSGHPVYIEQHIETEACAPEISVVLSFTSMNCLFGGHAKGSCC